MIRHDRPRLREHRGRRPDRRLAGDPAAAAWLAMTSICTRRAAIRASAPPNRAAPSTWRLPTAASTRFARRACSSELGDRAAADARPPDSSAAGSGRCSSPTGSDRTRSITPISRHRLNQSLIEIAARRGGIQFHFEHRLEGADSARGRRAFARLATGAALEVPMRPLLGGRRGGLGNAPPAGAAGRITSERDGSRARLQGADACRRRPAAASRCAAMRCISGHAATSC